LMPRRVRPAVESISWDCPGLAEPDGAGEPRPSFRGVPEPELAGEGDEAPVAGSIRERRIRREEEVRPVRGFDEEDAELEFIRKAAVWRAVAAAARRAAWARAWASFWDQSGRIWSIVMTCGALWGSWWWRRLEGFEGEAGEAGEAGEEEVVGGGDCCWD
jgi:hypothetical protein